MNRALLAKELQALRPIFYCICAVCAMSTGYILVAEMPDLQPFTPQIWVNHTRGDTFGIIALFTLMMSAGLLVQESENGTLRFLDGLPLSRSRLFVMKVVAALLIMACIPFLGFVTDVGFGWLTITSIDEPLAWRFALAVAGLQMIAGLLLLSVATVVSFVRSWFPFVAGLVFWAFLWGRQMGASWLSYIDPYAMMGLSIADGAIVWPWPQIGAHLATSAVFLFVAWQGFRHLGDRSQHLAERFARNRFLSGIGFGLKLFAPLVWFGAIIYLTSDNDAPRDVAATTPVGEKVFTRLVTKHYEFLLRTAQLEDAKALLLEADGIHDRVAAFLGAPSAPSRFVVDLASPVIQHAAGQTNWTKIRLPLTPGQELAEQRQILGHETTHAYIDQLGRGRLTKRFSSLRSLHEGLATYVEYTLFATDEQKTKRRRALAGAWVRGRIPFSLLVDDAALSHERDPNLVYPLGAELSRVLIETQGNDAPAKLLRALGRNAIPPGLSGESLWRDAMQAAGLNYERVVSAYDEACAKIAEEEKEFVATLPRLSAQVTVEREEIVVRPNPVENAPGRLVCIVNDDELFGLGVRVLSRREDGAFALPRNQHLSGTLRYLLGWYTPEMSQPIFEPWVETPLK